MSVSKRWMIGGAAVAALLVIVGWFFVVSPARDTASATWSEAEFQRTENDRLATRIATLAKQSAEVPAKLAEVDAVKRKMPADPKQAELVRSIEQQAQTAGVDLTGIAPSTPTALADSTEGTVVLPVGITAKGSYTAIKTFVDNLERQQRAFLITEVNVTAGDESATSGAGFDLTLAGNFFSLPEGALDNPAATAPHDDQPTAAASAKVKDSDTKARR